MKMTMPRGKAAEVGSTRVAPNGYHYTRTKNTWRLTHHIWAEKYLGRPLREGERVEFVGKDKTDFSEENLRVTQQGRSSLRRRKAVLEERIRELQAVLEDVNKELAK
jgi:hypothetical protein